MEKTTPHNKTIILAYKFIFGQVENICRLCLSPTENKIKIDNTVDLRTQYCNYTISYQTMLDNLNVPNESEMPQVLCKKCATLIINSYLFQKLRQFSSNKWIQILQLLKPLLLPINAMKLETKSIFLIINNRNNILLKSNKCYNDKPDKMKVFKTFVKCCQRYMTDGGKSKHYDCTQCAERLNSQYFLNKHMSLKHPKVDNQCKDCYKTFTTQNYLQIHVENKHCKNFHCEKCTESFSSSKDLKRHKNAEHAYLNCKVCNILCLTKRRLLQHMIKHTTRSCTSCNKKYKNMHIFQNHIKKCCVQKDIQEKYICDYCKKCYKRKNSLRSHFKTNHGLGNTLACNWCYKKFDAVSRLKNHILKHTKEKNFHCTECNGQFVSSAALVYHMRLHTGEKPFPCDLCNESFLSASRRMEHKKRKHIGPTKKCTLCDMKFITTYQLRKHFQRHFEPSSKLFITKNDLVELQRKGKVK